MWNKWNVVCFKNWATLMTSKNDTKDWKHSWNLLSRVKTKTELTVTFVEPISLGVGDKGGNRNANTRVPLLTKYNVPPTTPPFLQKYTKCCTTLVDSFHLAWQLEAIPTFQIVPLPLTSYFLVSSIWWFVPVWQTTYLTEKLFHFIKEDKCSP